MSEIIKKPITLAPGDIFTDETDEAIIFTARHTHRDILRYVIAELGDEARFHVDDLLGEIGP